MNPLLAKRKELGLTQTQVARLLGTKQSNISAYERGILEPGSVVERRLVAILDLHADSLYATGITQRLRLMQLSSRGFSRVRGLHPVAPNRGECVGRRTYFDS